MRDLLRAESDPSAWTLSQTQQATRTHSHTCNKHAETVEMKHSLNGQERTQCVHDVYLFVNVFRLLSRYMSAGSDTLADPSALVGSAR